MPRLPRKKNDIGIYHIIMRSISDINLFKNTKDKIKYLNIVKETQHLFKFKIYSYCLMSNHCHFIIDTCGADISKIMHRINFKYARYFNIKYNRHGHLFQDRFKSKLVHNEKYLYSLSLYIHKNPIDIKEYSRTPEKYRFSSLSAFMGSKSDEFEILDESFILSLLSQNLNNAREKYLELLLRTSNLKENLINLDENKSLYICGRVAIERNYNFNSILNFICNKFQIHINLLFSKNLRKLTHIRSLTVIMLRTLCNMSMLSICKVIGNICSSTVSHLSTLGLNLIMNNKLYVSIIDEYLCLY